MKQLKAGYRGSYGFREKVDLDGYSFAKRPFDLAEGLIRRGYNNPNIELILGGNFSRVLKEIWSV
jgi:membrane dipeptidase